jgi:SAM-dependent methyltransferase
MMKENSGLFDYRRVRSRAARAERIAMPGAGFLHARAADELVARLAVTRRDFSRAVDLFSGGSLLSRRIASERPAIAVERIGDGEGGARFGDRDDLGLSRESCDLAVSAFGLHRSNDLPGALVQIRQALRPDGLFMAALPGEGTLDELRAAMLEAEAGLAEGAQMRVEPFADIRQAGSLLQRAGFALPVVDTDKLILRYGDLASIIRDLRAIGATSALAGQPVPLPRMIQPALEQIYRREHADADGKLRVSVNIMYLTAWAPHPDQQKPLKPGSAEASLAKLLGR